MRAIFGLLFTAILFISPASAFAQDVHFIYIQSEDQNPFYVKLDTQVISSSESGYIIIPRLIDGAYDFRLGFNKNEWPEQGLKINVDTRDLGFVLKNIPDKGWGLLNLRNSQLTMHIEQKQEVAVQRELKNDAFSNMLAEVVNDQTIKEIDLPVTKTLVLEDKREDVVEATKPLEAPVSDIGITTAGGVATVPEATAATGSLITKAMEKQGADGLDMVYIDAGQDQADTIRIFLPSGKKASKRDLAKAVVKENPVAVDPPAAENKAEDKKDELKIQETQTDQKVAAGDDKIAGEEKKPGREKRRKEKKQEAKTSEVVVNSVSGQVADSSALTAAIPDLKFVEYKPETDKSKKGKKKADQSKKDEAANDGAEQKPADVPVTSTAANEPKFIEDQPTELKPEKKDRKKKSKTEERSEVVNKPEVEPDQAPKASVPEKSDPALSSASPVMVNSDCRKLADDDEYLKLRKKLAALEDNDKMLDIAKKAFKSSCFTTEQVKKLSGLFLNDEGRYRFFDAAYPFVYDTDHMKDLEAQLSDPYFINRFRAMLKK